MLSRFGDAAVGGLLIIKVKLFLFTYFFQFATFRLYYPLGRCNGNTTQWWAKALFLDPQRTSPWPLTHFSLNHEAFFLDPWRTSPWPGGLISQSKKRPKVVGKNIKYFFVKTKIPKIFIRFCGPNLVFNLGIPLRVVKKPFLPTKGLTKRRSCYIVTSNLGW